MLFNVVLLPLRVMCFHQAQPSSLYLYLRESPSIRKHLYAKIKGWNGGYQEKKGEGKWGVINQQAKSLSKMSKL